MRWLALLAFVLPGTLLAEAPETSQRPVARPSGIAAAYPATSAPLQSQRPRLRPGGRSDTAVAVEKVVVEQTITEDIVVRHSTATLSDPPKAPARPTGLVEEVRRPAGPARDRIASVRVVKHTARVVAASPLAVATSLKPKRRPKGLRTALVDTRRTDADKPVRYGKKGSVCGVRGIRGRHVAPVRGRGGCGIKNAVRITEIDGIKLTREALVGCGAAKALYGWVQKKAKPTVGRKGGGLAKIQLVAGYSCRTRNSRKGAKLSEHAKGNAVDIAGFVLKNGTSMSVLRDFRSGPHSKTMKRLHKSACGPFGTVLGPFADRYHQDHFHFDIARHRGGAYCR